MSKTETREKMVKDFEAFVATYNNKHWTDKEFPPERSSIIKP